MSATRIERTGLTDELGRASELACDEALFGLSPSGTRELDDAGEDIALLREHLALVTARLALREAGRREALPPNLRSIVQMQAFGYFERRGGAPTPTATTTGANIVELAPAEVKPLPRRRTWLTALAAAACFVVIGVTLRLQLGRDQAVGDSDPASRQTAAVALEASSPTSALPLVPLSASKRGAHAVLLQTGPERQLRFTLRGASDLQLPPTTALWIRTQQPSGTAWRHVAPIQPDADGSAHIELEADGLDTIVGFVVTVPTPEDPAAPDLGQAQLEASVRH